MVMHVYCTYHMGVNSIHWKVSNTIFPTLGILSANGMKYLKIPILDKSSYQEKIKNWIFSKGHCYLIQILIVIYLFLVIFSYSIQYFLCNTLGQVFSLSHWVSMSDKYFENLEWKLKPFLIIKVWSMLYFWKDNWPSKQGISKIII